MSTHLAQDSLFLEDFRIHCIIGDLPYEREQPQDILLNMEIFCDTRLAAKTDNLDDTVNYVAVMDAVRAALIDAKCKMIERAAQLAIDTTFAQDERILAVTVTLRKPHALNQAIAGIRIHRQR
jgi:dihydroneopterin aldolase